MTDPFAQVLEQLRVGVTALAWEIVRTVIRDELAKASFAKPIPVVRVAPKRARRPIPVDDDGHGSPLVGTLWKRRDGNTPRKVLGRSSTHIIVESPVYKEGTKVKRAEFLSRYKPVEAA